MIRAQRINVISMLLNSEALIFRITSYGRPAEAAKRLQIAGR